MRVAIDPQKVIILTLVRFLVNLSMISISFFYCYLISHLLLGLE